MTAEPETKQYEIRTDGDWCNGYYWGIYRVGYMKPIKECGPFHGELGRRDAFAAGIDYADRNGMTLTSTLNPH